MEVWLIPIGTIQFKSQLDRIILSIYFPDYEKLKSCVETFTPYNRKLILEEQLWMSIDFYFDHDQALINSIQDYRESLYILIYTVCD
jgi:hypothetical protein